MALLCILIGIIYERTSDTLEQMRNFHWYDSYSRWLLNTLPGLTKQNQSSIVILLLPILLVTGILQHWFDDKMMGLIEFLFGLVVFAFSLGPKDLNRQINRYLEARERGDEEAASSEASELMHSQAPADPDQQSVEVMRAILHEANDRFFAVIFWFVLLGPLGALLYRLTAHTMRTTGSATLQLDNCRRFSPGHRHTLWR